MSWCFIRGCQLGLPRKTRRDTHAPPMSRGVYFKELATLEPAGQARGLETWAALSCYALEAEFLFIREAAVFVLRLSMGRWRGDEVHSH